MRVRWPDAPGSETMKHQDPTGELKLDELLRRARPEVRLPAGFAAGVWRRIEAVDASIGFTGEPWWMRLVALWLEPRRALTTLLVVCVLGMATGLVQGWQQSERLARERYVARVSPVSPWP
jgi:hypothetical protein